MDNKLLVLLVWPSKHGEEGWLSFRNPCPLCKGEGMEWHSSMNAFPCLSCCGVVILRPNSTLNLQGSFEKWCNKNLCRKSLSTTIFKAPR